MIDELHLGKKTLCPREVLTEQHSSATIQRSKEANQVVNYEVQTLQHSITRQLLPVLKTQTEMVGWRALTITRDGAEQLEKTRRNIGNF